MAVGLPPKTRLMSAGGRVSQSMAFLKTPGIEFLWPKQAVGRRDRVFQRRDGVGNSIGGLPVSIIERDVADRADCQVGTRRHQRDRRPQQCRIERALTQAPRYSDEMCHAGLLTQRAALRDGNTTRAAPVNDLRR